MQKVPSPDPSPKVHSIGRRFSYALIGIISLVLIAFAAVVIFYDINRIEKGIEKRLENALLFAESSLATPLWNLDSLVVNDFVEALFLDEAIVYIKISWEERVITERKRPGFAPPPLALEASSEMLKTSDFIAQSSDIYFTDRIIGKISIVMTRDGVKQQAMLQFFGIVALLTLIIAAIWLTSIFITKRYITLPLINLQTSASMIAEGDLDTFVDKRSKDEIGLLAQQLDIMRQSIKHLFGELRDSKAEIEEHSRTLEQRVKLRTHELAQSVEELKALGEISQAVNSTLDLETVLTRIVRHAVQLSKADAGTIYEFDETENIFLPRINYGADKAFIEALRESKLRKEDQTVIGQAARKGAPNQIADLADVPDYPLPQLKHAGYRALLALPLLRDDRLIGGLVVRRKTAGEFPVPVVDLLQTFAAQSVLAIQNARLFHEIEEKSRELEIATKHKSMFLANMSHELRTPLNAILGYTELILDNIYGDVPQKIHAVLVRLEKNGRHLLNLINDVLDLSKIEAGQLSLSLNEYSMGALIQTVFASVESLAAEKQLKLSMALPEDPMVGKGDEQRIAQVILNLVGNAIKFTDAGEVKIEAGVSNEGFIVSVSDTGPGLAETDRQKIFEEFQQADGSSTRKKGGTGLGLSISKKIIEMHGGSIWVESSPGEGSIFRFKLPVRVEKERRVS